MMTTAGRKRGIRPPDRRTARVYDIEWSRAHADRAPGRAPGQYAASRRAGHDLGREYHDGLFPEWRVLSAIGAVRQRSPAGARKDDRLRDSDRRRGVLSGPKLRSN